MESPAPKARKSAIDDPFGRLPEHILHCILSLLPSGKEVARTALISRSWRRACSSYPLFDFDLEEFRPQSRKNPDDMHHSNERFLNFVDRSMSQLREQRIKLPRLKLHTGIMETDRLPSLCDKWIGMALDGHAQELNLRIYPENPDLLKLRWSYPIPANVLSSDFLKSLTITSASLTAPLDGITSVNLSSLQSLHLYSTTIGDQGLQKLLCGCPLLENLKLCNCSSLWQIIIRGLNFLRMVSIRLTWGNAARVEIEAPSLEKLEYSTYTCNDAIVLDGCRQLKHLKLWNGRLNDGRLRELLFQLPLLESLTIELCKVLKRIRIPNALLKEIKVLDCWNLRDINVDTPKLSSFVYRDSPGELPIIRMWNLTSLSNCEADLTITQLPFNEWWFRRLGKFLVQSCTRSLSVSVNFGGDVQPTYCQPPSFPCEIDQLNLDVRAPLSTHASIFEGLLSACRPTVIRVKPRGSNDSFLMMVCRKLAKRAEDTKCGCTRRTKCWLHELKTVEIGRVMKTDYGGPLDWCTLFDLLPTLERHNDVHFRLHW